MLWEAGEVVSAKSLTNALKERLLVHTPSVIEMVIREEPVCPAIGVTVIARLVPEPPKTRFPFGTKAGFEETAATCKDVPLVVPRLPKVKLSALLDPPGGMRTSAIGEICPANAVSAISKELLVVKCRNGAICS